METLGNKLKTKREKLNLSLKDVSEKIKIRPHILQSFEEDDFSVLPLVYSRSSVKNYANFLKISDKDFNELLPEVFNSLNQNIPAPQPNLTARIETNFKKSILNKENLYNKRNIINYLIYIGIGLTLFVFVYFIFFDQSSGSPYGKSEKSQSDTAVIAEKSKGLLSFFDKPDSVILEARAIDTSWLRIDVDGKLSEVVHMAPNLTKRWSAENYFLLTIGNVGSIEFKRNGTLLKPFGTKGSVVRNVKITKDDIINSSLPWSDADSGKMRRRVVVKKEPPEEPPKLLPSNIEPYRPFDKKDKK
ncbi:MAG: RodZ domain-containing protein [FCB group bacterium]